MFLANNPDPIITMLILRCGMENDQGYRTRPVPIMNHATKPLIAFHDKEPAILYDISFFGVASRRSLQDTYVVIIGKLWSFTNVISLLITSCCIHEDPPHNANLARSTKNKPYICILIGVAR